MNTSKSILLAFMLTFSLLLTACDKAETPATTPPTDSKIMAPEGDMKTTTEVKY